jgi:anaerobic ribonucleoside-triphosphate reductase activating protein
LKTIRLSNIIPISEANGPGPHYTIWVQGCSLQCPGCFNSHIHTSDGGYIQRIPEVIRNIAVLWLKKEIRGVTITGGEPLQQIKSVITLVRGIKAIGNIGTIVLTGYSHEKCIKLSGYKTLKQFTDVLIAGPFMQDFKIQEGIRGSSNKELLFLTDYYNYKEFSHIPPVEVFVDLEGSLSITGIKPEIINTMND